MEQTIPVVDLLAFTTGDAGQQKRFSESLGQSLKEYGFVAVDNHGVDTAAIADTYRLIGEFFALPEADKRRYEIEGGGGQRGYTSFGTEHAKNRSVADLKEFWHVGPELDEDHPVAGRIPRNVWPEGPLGAGLKAASLALTASLERCGATLLRALARYLDANEDEFAHMIDGGNSILRLIRYPGPDEIEPEEGAVWAAEHEDINLITLLAEATEPGLELLRRDGTWMSVAPVPGQLIADTGDMMQRLTNGLLPSTTHRVLAPPDADGPRYSMPYFIHPHPDYMLAPLDSCVSADNPRRWDDCTADEYLTERLREIGLVK